MSNQVLSRSFDLQPEDNLRLANLCGQLDEHIRQLERGLGVEINNRGFNFSVIGNTESVLIAERLLSELYADTNDKTLTASEIHLRLEQNRMNVSAGDATGTEIETVAVRTKRGVIRSRSPSQAAYLSNMQRYDLVFGIGPAGTGKTYLAVASAVEALESDRCRRLILVRPAVEAGEKLGFLPGDLAQKVDPYLRPMLDALYEMLGFEKVNKLMEKNIIEVAPLAYMRGRTLNESFIILDEAQNTTVEQMKMFLTRIGFGSTAVVNGDITQIDLPSSQQSGLRHVIDILKQVKGVSFNFFQADDVVRHPLVRRIVRAYDKHDNS